MKPMTCSTELPILILAAGLLLGGSWEADSQPRVESLRGGTWPVHLRGEASDIEVVGRHAFVTLSRGGFAVEFNDHDVRGSQKFYRIRQP